MSLLLTLNKFHTFIYLPTADIGKCMLWMVAFTAFALVIFICTYSRSGYRVIQKYGGVGGGEGQKFDRYDFTF